MQMRIKVQRASVCNVQCHCPLILADMHDQSYWTLSLMVRSNRGYHVAANCDWFEHMEFGSCQNKEHRVSGQGDKFTHRALRISYHTRLDRGSAFLFFFSCTVSNWYTVHKSTQDVRTASMYKAAFAYAANIRNRKSQSS